MQRRTYALALAAPVLVLAGTRSARAEVVNLINQTFDAAPAPAYNYAYGYAGGGNPQTDRGNLTSASATYGNAGVEGSRALSLNGDFTQLGTVAPMPDYNYSGFGGGFGTFFYDFGTNKASGLPVAEPRRLHRPHRLGRGGHRRRDRAGGNPGAVAVAG